MTSGVGASGECELVHGLHSTNWASKFITQPDGTVGTDSLYDGASPAVTAAELGVHSSVTSPSSYAVLVEPDGDDIIDSFGDLSRQSYAFDLYTWLTDSVDSYTIWSNNAVPAVVPDADAEDFIRTTAINVAMVDLDINALFTDADDASLTIAATTGAPLTGTTITAGVWAGTPTVYGWPNLFTVTATDIAGAPATAEFSEYVGDAVADVIDDSQAAGTATLEAQGFTVAVGTAHYSSTIAEGNIAVTSPAAEVVVEHESTVTIFLSLGPSKGMGRPFSFSWWSD